MAEIRNFPGSNRGRQNLARAYAPGEQSGAQTERYCVYNQTRERFVATDVESADDSTGKPDARLLDLGQAGKTGLWISPYLGISPTSVRFPVDLVFLNNDCVVVDTVASFPLAGLGAASAKAASVLALPAETLNGAGIGAGDQLIISAPSEMKGRLERIKEAKQSAPPFLDQFARSGTEEPSVAAVEAPVQDLFVAAPPPASEIAPPAQEVVAQQTPGDEVPAPAPRESCPWKERSKPADWLTRLLRGDEDPEDPRIAGRQSLPGLIAYYFTGGTPTAQEVRDISPKGLYIVTSERWYPGTVIRLTLTDRHNPVVERSITVNAKSMRWGSDGVGLEFILDEQKKRRDRDPQLPEQANGVDLAKVLEFLRNYKSPVPQS
jgi:hypothetical protein